MKPGTLIVFVGLLVVCGAAFQLLGPALDTIKETHPLRHAVACGSCGIGTLVVPFVCARAWNRWWPR